MKRLATSIKSSVAEFRELKRFQALPPQRREIVFYAESASFWQYFEQIIDQLTGRHGRGICYLTSGPDDPVLRVRNEAIAPFHIGVGLARTILFRALHAKVMVMTMPDLDRFHIKRSPHGVHYVFVPHNILSTHMVFRKGAYDHFDTFLCVGPHHKAELREAESLYGLKPRNLVEHGYGRIDKILAAGRFPGPPAGNRPNQVLIAPSWGPRGVFESGAEALVQVLLDAGYRVVARPHPDTRRLKGAALDEMSRRFGAHPSFALEENIAGFDSYLESDIMISDWSGAAFEFAFGLERPVLFIDVPMKVNNPDYQKYRSEPLEISLRSEIGAVVSPQRITEIPALIEALLADREKTAERIRAARSRWIYNVGRSGEVGAAYLHRLASKATPAI